MDNQSNTGDQRAIPAHSERLNFTLPGGTMGNITLIAPLELLTPEIRDQVVKMVEEKLKETPPNLFTIFHQTFDLYDLLDVGLVSRDAVEKLGPQRAGAHLSIDRVLNL